MADKSISELTEATSVGSEDLFVLQQNNTAKKLTGQILENWLLQLSQGHGGISVISKSKTVGIIDYYTIKYVDGTTAEFTVTNGNGISGVTKKSSGVTDTYTITFTNGSTFEFKVTNGNGISKIEKTKTEGLVDTYTITFADGTTTTYTVTNGEKGATGDNWYTAVRWASKVPTSDSDIGTVADAYIGVYAGKKAVSDLHYTDYEWYKYKGDKGDTGAASSVSGTEVVYGVTSDQSTPPSSWSSTMPQVAGGNFLWTKVTVTFNNTSSTTFYTKSRWGVDGTGSGTVTSVNGIDPVSGDVATLLFGSEDPTSATEGAAKQLYVNTSTNSMFVCTGVESGVYTWAMVSAAADYEMLTSKPSINGNPLSGNKTTSELGIKYADLPDKPTIPTVNDATLTIKRNGEQVGTFTANASKNVNIDIEVPDANDGVLTIKVNGTEIGTFSANTAENKEVDISVPSANNGKLTIQKNSSEVGTFTANSSDDAIVNITVPTNNNELTNGAGYITASSIPSNVSAFNNDAGYITSSAVPTKTSQLTNDSGFITSGNIPTRTSQLTNDSGFITASSIPSNISSFNNDSGYVTSSYSKPWTLMWQNSAPSSGFYSQTISMDLSSYSEVMIIVRQWTGSSNLEQPAIFPINGQVMQLNSLTNKFAYRKISVYSYEIGIGEGKYISGYNGDEVGANDFVVPYQIYAR